jgi:hypothetical protein
MDWNPADDSDEGVFAWALAHFRQNAVIFSRPPADRLSGWVDATDDVDTRRQRLNQLN